MLIDEQAISTAWEEDSHGRVFRFWAPTTRPENLEIFRGANPWPHVRDLPGSHEDTRFFGSLGDVYENEPAKVVRLYEESWSSNVLHEQPGAPFVWEPCFGNRVQKICWCSNREIAVRPISTRELKAFAIRGVGQSNHVLAYPDFPRAFPCDVNQPIVLLRTFERLARSARFLVCAWER